jgi:hypothetical protein
VHCHYTDIFFIGFVVSLLMASVGAKHEQSVLEYGDLYVNSLFLNEV